MAIALGLLAVLALILANGYFVAAEFAFVATRRGRLEELQEEGNGRAGHALVVLKRLSFMLSGAQLGITVTSLAAGFVSEPALTPVLLPLLRAVGVPESAAPGVAITVGFILVTAVQMVFGELAPKNLAIAEPDRFALLLARTVHLYTRLASPLIKLFDNASNALLRLVGIEPVEELSAAVSAEELEYIIGQSTRGGELRHATASLLSRALDFRQLRAGDAMVSRGHVDAIDASATGRDLRLLTVDSGHSRFPVIGDDGLDDVVGVVQAQDLLRVPRDSRDTTPVRALLKPVLAVPESTALAPLLGEMRRSHTQLAVVVDEYGGTAGIVTLEDIVEELVGNIEDEHDPVEPGIRSLTDGAYLVPGGWRLDEVEREIGVELPEGDYESVGGLVMERLGRVARVGDIVTAGDLKIEVASMDGLGVGSVRLSVDGGDR